ncbi:MAG: RNA polymerase sigma factor [Gammaproteobacteria bacterium]|nr:RNA polymerase sigma factor [Gammaproteobacteria bacterium]
MATMLDTSVEQTADEDRALALRAANGERAAFALLLERHYERVFRIALRWSGHRADAEDITQTVCIKLGAAIRSFRGEAKFTTWLYQLVLNASRDHLRTVRNTQQRDAAYAEHTELMQDDGGHGDDVSRALWAAVRQLPDKTRDAVLLVYGEDMSHAAAAAVLGCKEATLSWHIHDAKKRLAALLAPHGEVI